MTMQDEHEVSVFRHEEEHGKFLAEGDPERIWGWGTPAGKLRAQRRAEHILAGAGISSGMRILEVGCGVGNFTEIFAATGAKILAVDISPDLLAMARKRLANASNVRFACVPFEKCAEDGPFDAVIGSSVLHHLNVREALEKMFSLLAPAGRISFAEPNMLNPQLAFQLRFRRFFPQFSPDETAFIRFRLSGLLRDCGFTGIRITPFDWLHPATPSWAIPAVRFVGHVLEQLPLVREFSGSIHLCAQKTGKTVGTHL